MSGGVAVSNKQVETLCSAVSRLVREVSKFADTMGGKFGYVPTPESIELPENPTVIDILIEDVGQNTSRIVGIHHVFITEVLHKLGILEESPAKKA